MAEVRGGRFTASFVASGNMNAAGNQYTFVRQIAGNNMNVVTIPTSGVYAVGVLQDKPQDKEGAEVVTLGHSKIRLANSLGSNIYLMSGVSGFAVQYVPGSGVIALGRLITGATSGAVGEMIFLPTIVGSAVGVAI